MVVHTRSSDEERAIAMVHGRCGAGGASYGCYEGVGVESLLEMGALSLGEIRVCEEVCVGWLGFFGRMWGRR